MSSRDPARLNHSVLLAGDRLLPFGDVERFCPTIDFLQRDCLRIDALTLHLAAYYRTLQRDYSKIVAVCSLNYDKVTSLYPLTGSVYVDSFSCVLETDLKKILVLLLTNAVKPVIILQLTTALAIIAVILTCLLILRDRAASIAVKLYCLVIPVIHIYS